MYIGFFPFGGKAVSLRFKTSSICFVLNMIGGCEGTDDVLVCEFTTKCM